MTKNQDERQAGRPDWSSSSRRPHFWPNLLGRDPRRRSRKKKTVAGREVCAEYTGRRARLAMARPCAPPKKGPPTGFSRRHFLHCGTGLRAAPPAPLWGATNKRLFHVPNLRSSPPPRRADILPAVLPRRSNGLAPQTAQGTRFYRCGRTPSSGFPMARRLGSVAGARQPRRHVASQGHRPHARTSSSRTLNALRAGLPANNALFVGRPGAWGSLRSSRLPMPRSMSGSARDAGLFESLSRFHREDIESLP